MVRIPQRALVDVCCRGGMPGRLVAEPLISLTRPQATQAPKLKAVLTHNSSGEGSGHRRRCCPFRVRFADETLRDTALRYWERSCAGEQTGGGAPGLQKVPA